MKTGESDCDYHHSCHIFDPLIKNVVLNSSTPKKAIKTCNINS